MRKNHELAFYLFITCSNISTFIHLENYGSNVLSKVDFPQIVKGGLFMMAYGNN